MLNVHVSYSEKWVEFLNAVFFLHYGINHHRIWLTFLMKICFPGKTRSSLMDKQCWESLQHPADQSSMSAQLTVSVSKSQTTWCYCRICSKNCTLLFGRICSMTVLRLLFSRPGWADSFSFCFLVNSNNGIRCITATYCASRTMLSTQMHLC